MGLVIKKKIALDLLGDAYQDAFVIMKCISVQEYEKMDGSVKEVVLEHFLEGKIKQDDKLVDITKLNIKELPGEVFVHVFKVLTGVSDPKVPGDSESSSTPSTQTE